MRPRSLKFLLNSRNNFLRKIYLFYNIYLRNFKYLKGGSQFNEDIYLHSFFKKNYRGKFVDLGCFHPTRDNNTFRFYKKNWRGINVDLNPITIELFNFFRSKDININCAISDKKTSKKMYFVDDLSPLNNRHIFLKGDFYHLQDFYMDMDNLNSDLLLVLSLLIFL